MGASVKTKDSMVAMSGAIMPAPLAMPLRVTSTPPSRAVRVATFGKVSVVMMALAASSQALGFAFRSQASSTPWNLVASRGSPITPVEAMNTWEARPPAAPRAVALVRVQGLADHAGGSDEYLGGPAARGLGGDVGGELHRVRPLPAG